MKITLPRLGLSLFLASILLGCQNSPEHVHAQLETARELQKNYQYPEAIAILTTLIEDEDSLTLALSMRATLYGNMERFDSAKADHLRILAMEGATCDQKTMAANDISNNFMRVDAWDSCLRYQNICLGYQKQCLPDGIPRSFFAMSFCYQHKGEPKLALAALDSAKHYGATVYEYAKSRTSVYREMDDLDSALKYATLAIESQSEFNDGFITGWDYYLRAEIYQRKGELTSACLDWKQALQLRTEDAQAKLDSFCGGR